MGIDLFKIDSSLTKEQIHPYFNILNNEETYIPAKKVLELVSENYSDIDGNFVKSFQTVSFDQRLFELYIYCLLTEERFSFDRSFEYPDFVIIDEKRKIKFGVEVTSINQNIPLKQIHSSITNIPTFQTIDIKEKFLRWARILDTKLNHRIKENGIEKNYWELNHMHGKPFILAVNDFQGFMQMTWSFEILLTYCYGFYMVDSLQGFFPDEITNALKERLEKEIDLRFFSQAYAENISAIILNPSATLSKFNRIGKSLGFGKENISISCDKTIFNIVNGEIYTTRQLITNTSDYDEKFTEGLIVLHNPNALFPIYNELFPESLQFYEENGNLRVYSNQKENVLSCNQKNIIPLPRT